MQIWVLCLLPVVAAIIGYSTNYLAVKMLFHPRDKKRILFFDVQGIFPKRQEALGARLGEIVARELVSVDDISEKIKQAASSDQMQQAVDEHLDRLIREKLPVIFPMMSMFLNDELIVKIKKVFQAEILNITSDLTDKMSGNLKQTLNIEEMVREKVVQFSSDKLEAVLFEIMRKEFKFIEIVGGILGFVIGVVQVMIVYFGNLN
jgi:uncharacterized membrane protein YheB (UPF0754 family)